MKKKKNLVLRTLQVAAIILAVGGFFVILDFVVNLPENKNVWTALIGVLIALMQGYLIYIAYALLKSPSPKIIRHFCAAFSFLFLSRILEAPSSESFWDLLLALLYFPSMYILYRFMAWGINSRLWPSTKKTHEALQPSISSGG